MEEKKFLDSDHKCARCGVIYKMIENVGEMTIVCNILDTLLQMAYFLVVEYMQIMQ